MPPTVLVLFRADGMFSWGRLLSNADLCTNDNIYAPPPSWDVI